MQHKKCPTAPLYFHGCLCRVRRSAFKRAVRYRARRMRRCLQCHQKTNGFRV